MIKIKFIPLILLILLFLNSCSGIVESLGETKKNSSDEFLIKKKAPLILPPRFGELPKPSTENDKNIVSSNENELSFKKIIDQNSSTVTTKDNQKPINTIEESFIKKINKK
tara:strand:+ start:48 stop:380 length:333 start_codon:yes stop_codon:yes gene_type:complete